MLTLTHISTGAAPVSVNTSGRAHGWRHFIANLLIALAAMPC
jgi:hypothetical protein